MQHNLTQQQNPLTRINVGKHERTASVVGGIVLVAASLKRRDWLGLGMIAVAAELLYRGITGYCVIYRLLGIKTGEISAYELNARPVTEHQQDDTDYKDKVTLASEESFPASDPPGFIP